MTFPNYDIFLSLRIAFVLTNSVDPDEMQHHVVFHLRSSLFVKVPVYRFPVIKGLKSDVQFGKLASLEFRFKLCFHGW